MGRMNRRDELAAFLRARREALQPEEVGLPPGRARRTPGLRREEIALLAGVSVTWYTWLEQGRPINASVDVLDALARACVSTTPSAITCWRWPTRASSRDRAERSSTPPTRWCG